MLMFIFNRKLMRNKKFKEIMRNKRKKKMRNKNRMRVMVKVMRIKRMRKSRTNEDEGTCVMSDLQDSDFSEVRIDYISELVTHKYYNR
jgi:hypothetical protein